MQSMQNDGMLVPVGKHESRIIVIGSDHGGFLLKDIVKKWLISQGIKALDVGCKTQERCDYPAISDLIGKEVAKDLTGRAGIGICRTGIGIIIPAGKRMGIIPARCLTPEDAATCRKHNNSNMLGLGADLTSPDKAIEIVNAWVRTEFYPSISDEAYLQRYLQTRKLENQSRLSQ
jgi:RpiB/LacA/LacB family sugar-phosphate isomerase